MTGIDFSGVALAKAAELAASRGVEVEWIVADVLEHEPEPRGFDLVVVLYLQLPARRARTGDPLGGARRWRRAARWSCSATTRRTSTDGHGGPKDPAVLFTPEDVARELGGLVVERAEKVRRTVALDDGRGHRDRRVRACDQAQRSLTTNETWPTSLPYAGFFVVPKAGQTNRR